MPRRPDRLSFDDAQILGLESAAITGHTCKIVVLDPPSEGAPIDTAQLRRHVEARLGRVRRCRQRVALTPLRLARPAWVDYPEFDIREHVGGYEAGGGIDERRMLRIAAELMAERLDHTRPLWRMNVVGPLDDDRVAIVWRIHHCMADGVTAMRLGSQILWDSEPDPAPPEPDTWTPDPEPSRLTLAVTDLEQRASSAGRAIPRAARRVATPGEWVAAARAIARLPGALARELTPLGSDSALDHHVGSRRELAFVSHPLDTVRAIGKAAGKRFGSHVTVNDVLLAAIAGALRGWLGSEGDSQQLRVQIPVSMHHRDEKADALGNRDSFLFVDLPVHEPDPVRRLELINAETTIRKAAHDAEALYSFFHALGRLGPLGRDAVRAASGPREFSLSASNVPGPRGPIYVRGCRVAALYSVAEPADRHALRLSAVSCAGMMHFGLCTDPDALGGLGKMADGIDEAIAELRDLSG